MTTQVLTKLENNSKHQVLFRRFCECCLTTWIPRIIGLVFLYAGALKLVTPGDMVIVASFLGISTQFRTLFIISVALVEIWLGLALAVAPERRSSRWSAIACLTLFMWY